MSELVGFRLPSGRHGLPPYLVSESRRWRLIAAAAEVFAEEGPAGLSSEAIARRAGVSKSAFYDEFENVGGCLAEASRTAAEIVVGRLADACAEAVGEEERLRTGIEELLRVAAPEPALMTLLSPAAAASGPALAQVREDLIEKVAELIGRERTGCAPVAALLAVCGEGVGGLERPEVLRTQLVRLFRWTSP